MCMKLVCELEKKPTTGWKVVESGGKGYITPYVYMPIEVGLRYESQKWDPEENIYVFLNKIYAKKFLRWMEMAFGDGSLNLSNSFHLAKVKLGDHVWKGRVSVADDYPELGIKYFFTTDSIEVLQIEQ